MSIHGSLLSECPMLRNCSEECAKTLLLKAQPQVVLQKEDLLVPGQLCTDVFILITGSLQVTLPSAQTANAESGDDLIEPSTRKTTNAMASPKRATERGTGGLAEDSSPEGRKTKSRMDSSFRATKSEKLKGERLRFRVVEKPGHIIGLSEPFQQPMTYPFRVTALKTSQMVSLSRAHLADVLSVFHGADADGVCSVLRNDFVMCWETLKPRSRDDLGGPGNDSFQMPSSLDTIKQARELSDLREKVAGFESRLDGCVSGLSTVQAQTAVLPQMHEALRALVEAHSG